MILCAQLHCKRGGRRQEGQKRRRGEKMDPYMYISKHEQPPPPPSHTHTHTHTHYTHTLHTHTTHSQPSICELVRLTSVTFLGWWRKGGKKTVTHHHLLKLIQWETTGLKCDPTMSSCHGDVQKISVMRMKGSSKPMVSMTLNFLFISL